jgi:hypothetical protein
MNTTRIDHTTCPHGQNAKGRAWCREMRAGVLHRAGLGYLNGTPDQLEERVHEVALALVVEIATAYDLIYNSPISSCTKKCEHNDVGALVF